MASATGAGGAGAGATIDGSDTPDADAVWSFGFGSNMDVDALRRRKKVNVIRYTAAVLPKWKIAFSLPGLPYVEPGFALASRGGDDDEIHGVAILMPKADVATLDKVEQGYDKAWVSLTAYDGSSIDNAFVYVRQEGKSVLPPEQAIPSARYLNVLVSGAKAAGLNSAYIDKLAAHKVYEPSPATLARRAALPSPGALPEITVEELAKYDGNTEGLPVRVGVQGYVFECSSFFGRHKGRDITTRSLYQFRGLSLDDNDDRGRPPYPILSDIDASEPELREYMNRWLDHYAGKETGGPDDGPAVVVGYLKEFKEQQASGVTTWVCPEKK